MSAALSMSASASASAAAASLSTRPQVIQLYRQLLKTARSLPSHNHRAQVIHSCRRSFRSNSSLSSPASISFELQHAETQLDNLLAQLSHMKGIVRQQNAAATAAGNGHKRLFSTARYIAADVATPSTPSSASSTPFADLSLNVSSPPPSTPAADFWLGGVANPSAAAAAVSSSPLSSSAASLVPSSLVSSHIVHVLLTGNNTVVTLTSMTGDTKCWSSSGTAGFKNSKKSTYMACIAAGEQLGAKAKNQNITNVDLHVSGFHRNKKAVLKGLMKAGLNVLVIKDTTPIPFNGCKPRKQRRL